MCLGAHPAEPGRIVKQAIRYVFVTDYDVLLTEAARALVWMSERYLKETLGRLPQAPVANVVETLPEIWIRALYGNGSANAVRQNEETPPWRGLWKCRAATALAVDRLLELRSGAEARHARRRDLDRRTGLRVTALPRTTLGDVELPEAREGDLATGGELLLDRLQCGIDR